ncbi:hypothetical protein [Kitasatospora cineracea]|uniref:Uncharacterized protein n=1 Tax=Kitasatospora cineracea TaxID=88074 RepID=A0A3N4RJN2_9ACTN|nr:hypothetical protein [Kitasatospora cineracea]RPE28587.1 hypothetical protein EDD38_5724 [Kitasatospora cineracea]
MLHVPVDGAVSGCGQRIPPTARVSAPDPEWFLRGRCVGRCETTEAAMHKANPGLFFDLADSASMYCYHCYHCDREMTELWED